MSRTHPELPTSPDASGRFGDFGGQYVPETLMAALAELDAAYAAAKIDDAYWSELDGYLRDYVGRPSALYFARRLTEHLGGAQVWLKREDLNHTGAHKINNTLGQAILARRMGKRRLIAETGAGQHGVATATAAAVFGMPATVYMGAEDVRRQALNVYRMRLLGAQVVPVESGQRTLKDAINEALRDWMASVGDTHYVIGSVMGPHPFPMLVRDLQSVIGREAREQMLSATGRLPTAVIACVGGGSNAAGIFHPFVGDAGVRLIGVEAAGEGLDRRHSATIARGRPGVLHGMHTYVLQDEDGQTQAVHSVSAGLDYPGVGPEHAYWAASGRVRYESATDEEALAAFELLSRLEGILPALETAHAVAHVVNLAPTMSRNDTIVVNLSGRGDKDCVEVARLRGTMLG
ncbi:MAG: tryptophan synthase beta chain [Phycisphaerae bacterium]|nr:MAG: tryptophan synthase subunit beta [Planctomycetia bacterium]RIK71341.1 MAG: tryptophan synthase subunit beta [Planctomycetota bacterium]GJQ26460.1 MAG: tryptophan synthase beta chain [Phycisphaerae bacterium]